MVHQMNWKVVRRLNYPVYRHMIHTYRVNNAGTDPDSWHVSIFILNSSLLKPFK